MIRLATRLFPVWALLAAAIAWWQPAFFAPLKPAIVPLLGLVMFGMGITISRADLLRSLKRPKFIASGVALQYLLMPFIAWAVAGLLDLPPMLAAGLIVVGACPGGTASNVVCYLARGDVALSITLTLMSTLVAIVATPLLTWVYIGTRVDVPVMDMMASVAWVVLLPVGAGILLNARWGTRLQALKTLFPLMSIAAIVLIIAIIVALNAQRLAQVSLLVLLAVVLHNLAGLAGGYIAAIGLTRSRAERRTLAIEVGMQNSGLGVALAAQHFSALATLPGAVFSIWHNLSGALLAAVWSRRKESHESTCHTR